VARRSSKNSNGNDKDQETPQDDKAGNSGEPPESGEAGTVRPEAERGAAETEAMPDAGAETEDTAGPAEEATTQADAVEPADTAEAGVEPGTEGSDTVAAEPLDTASESEATETTETDSIDADGTDTAEAESLEGQPAYRDEAEAAALDAETAESDADRSGGTPEDAETASEPPPELDRPPEPAATRTIVERRGPGFIPLVLGGVVAAGLGYLASVYEVIPGLGEDNSAEIEAALDRQSGALSALQEQVAALDAAEAPSVDLTPVTDEIAALGARLDETASAVESLAERVTVLEERPVFSGDVSADAAEAAEAVAAMEEQMRAQEEEAARLAAEAQAAQEAAADAIAEAEAEAEAARARAEAEAALQSVRLAVTEGERFAEPLATLSASAEIPEALSAAAETGVASLEALQNGFPPAARDALPVALRETAGDGAMDRFTAFLQGQVAGRAIEPREGDGPDAVLSRAQAAVSAGDLETALAEISALPEAAQAEMADWVAQAEARIEVVTALDGVAEALSGTN
jgi:hypothetical protein